MLLRLFVSVVLVLLGARAAHAEPSDPGWSVGVTAAGKSDGSTGSEYANPATNQLHYLLLGVEVGYAMSPRFSLHASIGVGSIDGDDTDGQTLEVLVGPESVVRSGRVELGVRLDAGYAHLAYAWDELETEVDAVVFEPKAVLRLWLSLRWSLAVQAGPRMKWIVAVDGPDDDDGKPQFGFALAGLLAYRL